MTDTFAFTATLWEYDGAAAWYFLSLPHDLADAVADASDERRAGFGSVRVEVTIGDSTWRTSLFPDARRATYVLPVKRAVRTAERLIDGASADVRLRLIEPGSG